MIIISTVRSSREFVEYDLKHTLGFVANPRRFNGTCSCTVSTTIYVLRCKPLQVAVTCAQALLVVVSDPNVLALDPLWCSFLNYVYKCGGWKGPPPQWDTNAEVDETSAYQQRMVGSALVDMNEFARRMEMLTLNGMSASDTDNEDDMDVNVDRPWRDVE